MGSGGTLSPGMLFVPEMSGFAHSRRYGDLKQVLVPMIAAQENAKLAVPSNPQDWLADRKARLTIALKRLARAARNGTIPHGSIEDGTLRIDRLTADVPDGAEALILDLYRRMPSVRITDMLLEVDAALGFTDAFTHLRTGAPCRDRIGLLNVLLAEGLNLGLRKMAEATKTYRQKFRHKWLSRQSQRLTEQKYTDIHHGHRTDQPRYANVAQLTNDR